MDKEKKDAEEQMRTGKERQSNSEIDPNSAVEIKKPRITITKEHKENRKQFPKREIKVEIGQCSDTAKGVNSGKFG